MSKPKIHWDKYHLERIHREKVVRKTQKIQTLRALLEMHEADPDHDHDYVIGLRARLRSVENQFAAMKP
jgi:hypothetical protein